MANHSKTVRKRPRADILRETLTDRFIGQDDVARFRKFAVAYTKSATRSRASARAALRKAGILTRAGKLSAKYK
jgi:hypothetical protein